MQTVPGKGPWPRTRQALFSRRQFQKELPAKCHLPPTHPTADGISPSFLRRITVAQRGPHDRPGQRNYNGIISGGLLLTILASWLDSNSSAGHMPIFIIDFGLFISCHIIPSSLGTHSFTLQELLMDPIMSFPLSVPLHMLLPLPGIPFDPFFSLLGKHPHSSDPDQILPLLVFHPILYVSLTFIHSSIQSFDIYLLYI